jgi:hypothetical protein
MKVNGTDSHSMGEMLIGYEAADDEKGARKLCNDIVHKLRTGGVDGRTVGSGTGPSEDKKETKGNEGKKGRNGGNKENKEVKRTVEEEEEEILKEEADLADDNNESVEWVYATEWQRNTLRDGVPVMSLYNEDNRWYPAVITSMLPNKHFIVKFADFGAEVSLDFSSFIPPLLSHHLRHRLKYRFIKSRLSQQVITITMIAGWYY